MSTESDVSDPSGSDARSLFDETLTVVDAWLAELRGDERRRHIALTLAVTTGLVLAWLHWVGLVIAGALVGLTRPRLRGAVAAGLAFGVLVIGLTLIIGSTSGFMVFVTLRPVSYVTLVLGLVLPVWGSLTRYVL